MPAGGERQVEVGQLAREVGRELPGRGCERLGLRIPGRPERCVGRTVPLGVLVKTGQLAACGD